tara:strand:- start:1599 stop:1856 length:258 start_codon:yes stop_codon:yes gene_type:complete
MKKLYRFIVETFGVAPYGGIGPNGGKWVKIETAFNDKAQQLINKCNEIAGISAKFMPQTPQYPSGVMINVASTMSEDDFVSHLSS